MSKTLKSYLMVRGQVRIGGYLVGAPAIVQLTDADAVEAIARGQVRAFAPGENTKRALELQREAMRRNSIDHTSIKNVHGLS